MPSDKAQIQLLTDRLNKVEAAMGPILKGGAGRHALTGLMRGGDAGDVLQNKAQGDDPPQYEWDKRVVDPLLDGGTVETPSVTVVEDTGAIKLKLEASGGGDLTFRFGSVSYRLDCTPAAEVTLTAGTDIAPVENFIYVTESGGTLTLTKDTSGFPTSGAFASVATVIVQSAASVATDGAFKVHAYTDHFSEQLSHILRKLREGHASWVSGVAPSDLVVSSPNAYISVTAGKVFQVHPHTMPAIDMQTPAPVYLVNDPTTAFKRITTFDDITQDASGNGINNKYMNLVLWGVVSELEADCKLFINLPTDVYTVESSGQNDVDQTAVYALPTNFVGTAFLIARYTVKARDSGAWSQSQKVDLRGFFPSSAAGGGLGTTGDEHPVSDPTILVHNATDPTKQFRVDAATIGTGQTRVLTMANANIDLTPASGSFAASTHDHTTLVLVDGTRPLTGDWDNIGRRIRNTGVAEVAASAPSTPATGVVWLDTSATGSGGTGVLAVSTITTDTTLTTSFTVVLCDATSGVITVTLSAAASNNGRRYFIKKIDSSANAVTIDGNASETIDGSTTKVLSSQYDSAEIVCDGTEWWII